MVSTEWSKRKRQKLSQPFVFLPVEPLLSAELMDDNVLHDSLFDRVYNRVYNYADTTGARILKRIWCLRQKLAVCFSSEVIEEVDKCMEKREFLKTLQIEDHESIRSYDSREKSATMTVRFSPLASSSQTKLTHKGLQFVPWTLKSGDVRLHLLHQVNDGRFEIKLDNKTIFTCMYPLTHLLTEFRFDTIVVIEPSVTCDANAWENISKRLRLPYNTCSSSFLLSILARLISPDQHQILRSLDHSTYNINRKLLLAEHDISPSIIYSFFKESQYFQRDRIISTLSSSFPVGIILLLLDFIFE